jgi:hypothetical protein
MRSSTSSFAAMGSPLAVLCLLLCTFPVANAFGRAEEGLGLVIGGSSLNFDYREFTEQGRLLDRESGHIPGVMFEVSRSQSRWELAGKLSYHEGGTTYDGQTNGGVPVTTVTKQRLVDVELRAEYGVADAEVTDARLYAGAAHHAWRRDIQSARTALGMPVSGLLETYRWWQVFFGAKKSLVESGRLGWSVDARIARCIAPTIMVDFAGQNDNVRLALGERWGARLALPVHYSMSKSTLLFVEPSLERSALGRSAVVPLTRSGVVIGAVQEPDSSSNSFGLVVGVRQYF